MYSVKPGRGPSVMGGIGSIFGAVFGIIWTFGAASMGAPPFFVLFGVVFVVLAIVQAVYNFANAGSRDRMSVFDVTTDQEEGDPIAQALGYQQPRDDAADRGAKPGRKFAGAFCPYCGERLQANFDYCPKCGKDV